MKPPVKTPKPRGICPQCGRKGLGVTFPSADGGTYRQCTYCSHTVTTIRTAGHQANQSPH